MRRRVGTAVRSAREVAASLREAPFRAALVVSALLHVLLFAGVKIGPAAGGRPPAPAMRLQIIRVLPEGEAAALLAPPPSPTPARAAPDSPGRRGGVDPRPHVKTGPASVPAATAADPVVPAIPADPAVPAIPGAGLIPARPVAETMTPAEQKMPEVEPTSVLAEPVAEIPLGPPLSKGEGGGFDDPGSAAPAGGTTAAAGVGAGAEPAAAPGVSGAPLASGQAGIGGSGEHGVVPAASTAAAAPPAYDPAALADLRRRIDARKVYPQLAVRNGWQGRVLVELHLGGDGRLAGLRLLEGSGYRVLDEATLAAVRRAAPFPAVAGPITVPVEYRLTP